MLVLGRKLFLGENFRVADHPGVNESSSLRIYVYQSALDFANQFHRPYDWYPA